MGDRAPRRSHAALLSRPAPRDGIGGKARDTVHYASHAGGGAERGAHDDARRGSAASAGAPRAPFEEAARWMRRARHAVLRARALIGHGSRARTARSGRRACAGDVPTARIGDRRVAQSSLRPRDSHRHDGCGDGRRHSDRSGASRLMPGKPGFRVNTNWHRPDAAVLAAFGDASSAQVADCMSRLGAMDAGIRPMWPNARVIGAALTAWCHAGDNLMIHKALSLAVPGDILVVNTQGAGNSGFGELLATSAAKAGVGAVIVDGTVRDAEALQAMGLPVYARGLCPNGCNKDGPGEV